MCILAAKDGCIDVLIEGNLGDPSGKQLNGKEGSVGRESRREPQ
jgi:hypothetical protein